MGVVVVVGSVVGWFCGCCWLVWSFLRAVRLVVCVVGVLVVWCGGHLLGLFGCVSLSGVCGGGGQILLCVDCFHFLGCGFGCVCWLLFFCWCFGRRMGLRWNGVVAFSVCVC